MRTVTIKDAAELKGVSPQAIRAAIKAGKLETTIVEVPNLRIVAASLKNFQPNPNMKRAGRPRNGSKSKSRKEK